MAKSGSTFKEVLAQLTDLWKTMGIFLKHPDIEKVETRTYIEEGYPPQVVLIVL